MYKIGLLAGVVFLLAQPALAQYDRGAQRAFAHASPQEVFDHHDANGDGMLSPDEYANSYNFDPAQHCAGPSIETQDPRCLHRPSHTTHETHIHIHHNHHIHHMQ